MRIKQSYLSFTLQWIIYFYLIILFCSPTLASTVTLNHLSMANELGWVPNDIGICKGYYQNPLQAYTHIPLVNLKQAYTHINAAQSHFSFEGTSTLSGNVVITQPGRILYADQVYFYRDPKTGKITNMDLNGEIRIHEPNLLIKAKKAHLNIDTQTGYLTNIIYRILLRNSTILMGTNEKMPINAWGTASKAEQNYPGLITLHDTNYTTCTPINPIWQLFAKKMILNRDTGRGKAYDTWLTYRGVPILYSPYIGFPIDNRRQSGFLFPNINSTSQSGFGIGFPYYWNIATNYDFLFTPTVLSKRGLQLTGQLRYLTHSSQGKMIANYLPYDRAAAQLAEQIPFLYPNTNPLISPHTNRKSFTWQEQRQWSPRWSSLVDFNWVGDDYYYEDFNTPSTIAINQLAQHAEINYNGDIWDFRTRIMRYQTLHPLNQSPVNNPYNSLPEIDLNSSTQTFHGFNYQLTNQLNYFQRLNNPGELVSPPQALRLNIQPSISYPILKKGAYITPRLQLSLTHYNISNQVPGFQSEIQRTTPIFNIDSGLYFDRQFNWGNHPYQQTLEPRLFYLYVPYRDQNNIPIFDSALIPFSYDSLFMTNRFSGYDRIGDANQISFALTTRLLDQTTGAEKLRASIGDIYYFENRRVTLCSSLEKRLSTVGTLCADPFAVVGATSPTEKFSPIAGQLNYNLSPRWSTTADIAWDPSSHDIINAAANVQYHPHPNQLFNINYGRIRYGDALVTSPPTPPNSHQNDFNRLGFSFATPLKNQWSTVGGWNYNFSHDYSQSYFYGLQYDSCCWAFRVVAGRTFYALNQNSNPIFSNMIYFQLQFKGLSTIGISDITSFLTTNIPGYADNFQSGANPL
ncbi:MAG: LPS-assembly protein LptD [Rickettsiella sp.]|nr:LPS-assembly protein LptD [Rickettsiella sp.]